MTHELYLLDLLGVTVFAVSGVLAAGRAGLDLFGVIVVAALTAVGGGTLRDLRLNRHPIVWMAAPAYLLVIGAAALLTVGYVHVLPPPRAALLVADALGLALFALSGAPMAEAAHLSPVIVVRMGTMTGVAGSVLRDVLTGKMPRLFQCDIYAAAAIGGIALYLLLQALGLERRWAFGGGMAVVVALRLPSLRWGWQLPLFRLPREPR